MDNKIISVQSEGRASFDLAIKLMFTSKYDEENEPKKTANHYFDHPTRGFILLWSNDKFEVPNSVNKFELVSAVALPYPLKWKDAANLAWGWLLNQPDIKYHDKLDHDGDNGKGFKVYNEDWGHVAGSHYAICGVQPIWAWYGK